RDLLARRDGRQMIADVAIDQIRHSRCLAPGALGGSRIAAVINLLAKLLRSRAGGGDRPGGVGADRVTALTPADPVVNKKASGAILAAFGWGVDANAEATDTISTTIPKRDNPGRRGRGIAYQLVGQFH